MQELTHFQRDILYVLADLEDPKGLAVKEELELYYNEQINHGRLYPNLDKLVNIGYINKGQIDKRTNKYMLNGDGKDLLKRRRSWEDRRVDL